MKKCYQGSNSCVVLGFRKVKNASNRRGEGNTKGLLTATPMEKKIRLNKRDALKMHVQT